MRFRKYHGIGNDFVMLLDLDGRLGPFGTLQPRLVAALCDRHTGVGADGVIRVLGPGDPEVAGGGAVLGMDYYNADGLPAEMCGNGIRCLAVLAEREGLIVPEDVHPIHTGGGLRHVSINPDGRVAVNMGRPSLERPDVPMSGEGSAVDAGVEAPDGRVWTGTGVSMGNPHFVVFADELGIPVDDDLVHGVGPVLETHPAFPQRTNVEFVEVRSGMEIRMRVWERGVGETMACGTGACAVAVAAAARGRTGRRVIVHLPGGPLEIDWKEDGPVWMTGPAEEVCSGSIDPAWLDARGIALPAPIEGGR